jgi:DNA replication protein DnaC
LVRLADLAFASHRREPAVIVTADANAGGAATAGGVDFQALVGAWMAVRALAEQAVSPLWGLPGNVVLTAVRAEVAAAVDDLMLTTSADGHIYIQAKTGVQLSDLPGSVLGAAVDQFVRLYLASLKSHPMDPTRDRIVLATAHITGTIEDLSTVLMRIRDLGTPARPEDCVTNKGETEALEKATTLVRHFWKAEKNVEPTWLEMRPLLQLMWISRFQLEADGAEEQLAKILLRTAILHEPTQADTAWSVLRVNAIKLAKTRSGVNRAELQKSLINDQIHLRSMRSYDADTAELKAHTKRSLRSLARFSRIRYDGHDVRIRRSYEAVLQAEAEAASLLVIGDAGCGKSGLLSLTVEALVAAGRDVLVLNAGELGSNSMGTLRNELSLRHDLIDVLEQWHGTQPAFLIIDALDSARDEKRQGMLRQLIEQTQDLCGRWRVVATIRKFDLRHGRNWRRLMPGKGIRPHYDASFDDVRHMNVERLSTDELDSLKGDAPDLHKMIADAPPEVAELVRVPFNLMLANELRSGGAATDLASITTQLQLLDLYWDRRLGSFPERSKREAVIATIADSMVKTRVLQVPASVVEDSASLKEALTEAVLLESAGAVQFSHHILFDYAVERLLLRSDTTATIHRLAEDRDLAISVGPSLKFWLEGHWERDATRTGFWKASTQLVASNAPSIAKIVSGTVAAAKTLTPSDAQPLLIEIGTETGARLFGFAADAITADVARIAARVPNPWFEIFANVAAKGSPFLAHRASYVLHALLDAQAPTPEGLVHAGRAARRMLVVAWEASPRFRPAVVSALRAVGRTFRSNVTESASLLARALEPEHVKAFAHEELQWLARVVPELTAAPDLLRDLYDATFAATGDADHKTVMSNSQIFGFTSTAKQDIEAAQWQLGEQFPALAESDPELALKIALRVASQYSRRENLRVDSAPATFRLLDRQAQFVPEPYGAFRSSHDEEPQIVDAAVTQLATLAKSEPARATEMLRLVADENTTALVWRSLIEEAATSQPLFELLRALLFEPAILRTFTKQLIRWTQSYQNLLHPQDRERLQTAAMDLRDGSLGDVAAVRLLRAIDPDHLSQGARDWLADQDKVIEEQIAMFPQGPSDDIDDEVELLVARGMAPVDARNPTNVLMRTRTKALESRSSELTKEATGDQFETIDEELRVIRRGLDRDAVHATQVSSSWGVIAEVATKMAILGRDNIADILLEAAQRPEPNLDTEQEAQFARSPSWGGGQARIEAVRGLLAIASRSDDEAVISAIRGLATDAVAAVRYHVVQDAGWLAKRHPQLFWQLVEALIVDENDGVVGGLFRGTIRVALVQDRQRGIALLIRTYAAAVSAKRSDGVIEDLFEETLAQYVWTGDQSLANVVNSIADQVLDNAQRLGHAVMSLRSWLTYTNEKEPARSDERRLRAIDYVRRVVSVAVPAFAALTSRPHLTDADRAQLQAVAKMLMEVAQELYFGSLAHDAAEESPDPLVRKRFYQETRDILGTLAGVGLPAAAHYLVQTLSSFVALVDPVDVFLLLGTTVRAGTRGGYQYESLAVTEIVTVVQRYLADFRAIFVDSEECRAALRDILDIFVDAGWSETHRLVYSLDSIFK